MNFYRAHSNNSLLVALASAIVIDGVLTAVVLHQHHDHNTANGPVSVRTAPTVSILAGANIVATPNAVIHPDPTASPDPVDTSVGSAAPAPGSSGRR